MSKHLYAPKCIENYSGEICNGLVNEDNDKVDKDNKKTLLHHLSRCMSTGVIIACKMCF